MFSEPSIERADDRVRRQTARSILSPTRGFNAEAGFTHSLTPARNCTFGCQYCYVPTLRVQGGLQPEDWRRWGRFTNFKTNAAELLDRELRPNQVVYCSPLTDPYQPAERDERAMPAILEAVARRPPLVFTIQTRAPLILRDVDLLLRVAERTTLRVGFSVTTNRDAIRRRYEPHCETVDERFAAIRRLSDAGIRVHAVLAPLLPCDPEELAGRALEATAEPLVCDPFCVRATKPNGATTREPAWRIAERLDDRAWFDPAYQADVVARLRGRAEAAGRGFGAGPAGFAFLARPAGG